MVEKEVKIKTSVDPEPLEDLIEKLNVVTDADGMIVSIEPVVDDSDVEKLNEDLDKTEEAAEGARDPLEQIGELLNGFVGAEAFSQLADGLWNLADRAGTFEDSLMRARLEAEGAGIGVNDLTDTVSQLSAATGRAGGEIRESFINATARGITDMDSFKSMMEGAGAQATLFGTDIQSMADKFSNMAMRSTLMERSLASTGITMEELAEAMGMSGATADEVKEKWKELDTNQRAAILGQAASMNEGKNANEEYKHSWAGLQEQIDIAKGRLERLAGEVLLPVLIPALETAARVLSWVGDVVQGVMDGPFGGLVSVIGVVAAGFALAVPAYMAVSGAITLLTATAIPAAIALWGMVAPLLPFIIIGAAVVLIIYEIGKAFGWWTDVSSMLDAIWAGVQRLWSAFINHPDVQAIIGAMQAAWEALQPAIKSIIRWVGSFFNASNGSRFDAVRGFINAIGLAWQAVTLPIRLVIRILQTLWGVITTTLGYWNQAAAKARSVSSMISSAFNGVKGQVQSAFNGVTHAITAPFESAYNTLKPIIDNIKNAYNMLTSLGGSAGIITGSAGISMGGVDGIGNANSNLMTRVNNSVGGTTNISLNGIIEESAGDFIVRKLNDEIYKQNVLRGV